MSYYVYGLIDPRSNRLFYVGQTESVRQRMTQHNAGDWASPAYQICIAIKAAGLRVSFCIFGQFPERIAAKRLERSLILALPDLVNSKSVRAMLSQVLYPMTAEDDAAVKETTDPMPEAISYLSLIDSRMSHLGHGTRQP